MPTPLHLSQLNAADAPKEKCAVFGVWGAPDAVPIAYYGLYALQHRGQESAGIAASDGEAIHGHTGMGLVSEVFGPRVIRDLTEAASERSGRPAGAIGHTRYSTYGSKTSNCQPIIQSYAAGPVAVAHNGNLVNAGLIRRIYEDAGHIFHTSSDTEIIFHLLAAPEAQRAADPLALTLRKLQGAFSLAILFPDRIEAARDPWGWRPLCLGETEDGCSVVASETVALDAIGAKRLRSVEPGEIVTLSEGGFTSRRFADPAPRRAHCVFEHVYFANPASRIFGPDRPGRPRAPRRATRQGSPRGRRLGHAHARLRTLGRQRLRPRELDPLPRGHRPQPLRRAHLHQAHPAAERQRAVSLKLSVVDEIVAGKRIIVVDDSIVRGTTTRAKMEQLYKAGAKEVHLRISCPPIRHPCFFGVDFAERTQLVAHERTEDEIRDFLGVDSLHFLSLEGLLASADSPSVPREHYCTACYSGEYRIDVEHPHAEGVLTDRQMTIFEDG